jgi:hypothetical protein
MNHGNYPFPFSLRRPLALAGNPPAATLVARCVVQFFPHSFSQSSSDGPVGVFRPVCPLIPGKLARRGRTLEVPPLAGTRGWKPRSLAAKDGRRHVEARFQRASEGGIPAAGFWWYFQDALVRRGGCMKFSLSPGAFSSILRPVVLWPPPSNSS